jgi:hypothetical protein
MVKTLPALVLRLKSIPSRRWEAIALAAGCAASLPRKVVYEADERNFGIKTLEPLFAFFEDIDAGAREMPSEDAKAAA